MVGATAVAGYLLLWLALRAIALRFATTATVVRRSPWLTRIALGYSFLCALALAVMRLWPGFDRPELGLERLSAGIAMVALSLVAEAVCLRSLGDLYSLEMAVKSNHVVIRTGMYRLVRHPIYVSNIVGYVGVCLLLGHWAAWVGLVAQAVGFVSMAQREEEFLVKHLGNTYEQYRRQVRWMFVPGVL